MFSEMMKYDKAWNKFFVWFEHKYKESYHSDFILSTMPFFFDEKTKIMIVVGNKRCELWNTENRYKYKFLYEFMDDDRQKALISACEKAFEILEQNLNKEM